MKIYRYALEIIDHQDVELPLGYELLSVAPSRDCPNGLIDLWAIVDEEAPAVPVGIYVVGTGNPLPFDLMSRRSFVGTAVAPDGLVWHVFEGPA